MNKLKKLIAMGVTVSMLMSFVAVLPVSAITIADGDLVKTADTSAVYYIQGANKRVFPHYNVYLSWGYAADFSTVKTVSSSELAAYADANAMPFRDGALFRGTAASLGDKDATAVFYVENAVLRPVLSEQVYQGLFSDATWSKVTWVPDDLLVKFNYDMGSNLSSSATHPNGVVFQYSGSTQKYVVESGAKRAISEAAFTANRYRAVDVLTLETSETYADGTSITGVESGILTPGWLGTVAVTSALTASLSSDNPAGATLPNKATNISLIKVRLTAGSSVATVTGLTFKRTGVGARGDWADGLYVYEGSTRLTTSAKSLSSDTEEVEFSALNLSISANSSKILTLRGDLLAAGATANNEHVFSLKAVETTATISGLPINGNKFTVGGSNVGGVTHTLRSGEVVNPTVGQAEAKIYAFYIEADSTHDCELNQIVLTKTGTISSSNVTNIKLYQESTLIASASTFASNDTVTLTPTTSFSIEKGKKKSFIVKADLGGKRDETLSIKLDETSHLVAYDSFYGYGATITRSNTVQSIVLQGGDITLSFNGPSAADMAQNASDVTIMKFSMTSEARVEVKKLKVTLTLGSDGVLDTLDFKDLRIKDANGTTLMGPYDWLAADEDDSSVVKTFSDPFTLAANTTRNFLVTVDSATTAENNLTIKAKVEVPVESGSGTTETREMKDLDSNLYVLTSSVVPFSLTGYDATVKTSSLTVSRASIPVSKTTVAGTSDVESFGVNLVAGSASGIRVSQLVAKIIGATANNDWTTAATTNDARTYVNTVDLYDGTTKLGSANLVAGTEESTLTYNNLVINIAKSGSKKLTFKANITTGIGAQVYYYIDVDQANITAYDDADNDKTPSTGLKNTTTPSVVVTVATEGGITAAADSSTQESGILVAGSTGNEVSKIKFSATNEAWTVDELKVVLLNGNPSGSSYERSISKVYLSYGNTTVSGDLAPQSSGNDSEASFTGLSINVPKDDDIVVTIKADLSLIANGAVSGDSIKLGLDSVMRATSASGGTDVSLAGADVYGNPMVLYKTAPTIVKETVTNTTLANAEMELYKFNIAADAKEDVSVKQLMFNVTLSDGSAAGTPEISSLAFYRGTTKIPATDIIIGVFAASAPTTSDAVVATTDDRIVVSWKTGKEEVISKGDNKSYTLKGTVTGTATGDSVMTRLAEEIATDYQVDKPYKVEAGDYDYLGLSASVSNAYLVWSDNSATSHNSTIGASGTADWMNSYKVKTLPSDYTVLSR